MDDGKRLLLAVFLAGGSLLVGLSVPLIRRRVPPNLLYGFRTPRTLADRDLWYAVNRYAAWRMLWVGVALDAVATFAGLVPEVGVAAYGWICLAVVAVGLCTALTLSFRHLRQLGRAPSGRPNGRRQ